jgi:hypothetical protein
MPKFAFKESFNEIISCKVSALAADTAGLVAGYLTDADVGKGVKLGATDRYILALDGDEIEGFLVSVESATIDGYTFGSIVKTGNKEITFQGAGIVIGSIVVFGTPIAKGTALTVPPAVKLGAAIAASQAKPYGWNPSTHVWRVISGTGVAGTQGIIERVGEA